MYVFYLYLYLTSFYSSQLWSFLFVTGINDGYLTANTRFLLELTFLLTHHEPLLDEFWGLKERYKVFCIKKKKRKEDSIWEGERKKKKAQENATKYNDEGFFLLLPLLPLFSSELHFVLCSPFNSLLWNSGIVDHIYFSNTCIWG